MKPRVTTLRNFVWIVFGLSTCFTIHAVSQTNDAWTRQAFLGGFASDFEVNRLVRAVAAKPTYDEAISEITALGNRRSSTAGAALLRIAYGEIGQQYVKHASIKFAGALADKAQARALLVSADPEVLQEGFRTLRGQPLDDALFARAGMALTNNSLMLRQTIATVFQADTNAARTEMKTALIASSMKTVLACTGAQRLERQPESFFDHSFPVGEMALGTLAWNLGKTKGVTAQMIRAMLGSEPGIVRDFAVIAMAYASTPAMSVAQETPLERRMALAIFSTNAPAFFRCDPPVLEQLYGVLTNSSSLTARFAAMSYLSWKPQPQDVQTLKWVAANDLFQSKPADPFYFRMVGADESLRGKKDAVIYPLRFLAEQNLKRLER